MVDARACRAGGKITAGAKVHFPCHLTRVEEEIGAVHALKSRNGGGREIDATEPTFILQPLLGTSAFSHSQPPLPSPPSSPDPLHLEAGAGGDARKLA